MIDFNFSLPTKIYFGKQKEKLIGSLLKQHGFNHVALIYGGGSIKRSGLYATVIQSLKENDVTAIEISGVEPNPKLSFVKKALPILKKEKIDAILAVGGGSVIDTAKSLSHAYYYDGDPFDFNLKKVATPYKALPVAVILTIAAAGSEMSNSCVISNDEVMPYLKKGFNAETNRPLFSILNPELTYSVSPYQTSCGTVDIMMHTLERYMNPKEQCDLSEKMAEGLLQCVLHYGKVAYQNPLDYEARAELLLASSFSHNGITGLGKTQQMRVHGLEHILSGVHDEVAHGAGLAILWPAWCRYVLKNPLAEEKLTRLAKVLFGVETAKEGIDCFYRYFKEIGMPTSLKEIQIDDVEAMALAYSGNKTLQIDDFEILDYQAALEIYTIALKGNEHD